MSYGYNRATNQLSNAAQTGGSTLGYSYDAAGNLTWDRVADIFGATVAQPAGMTTTNPLRFPGQQYDAATGLHYNHFRDYDPVLGRYIQSDPIVLAGGIDTFAYVGGNPLSGIDPLGLDTLVIDSGPISGNPFGHSAIAITGRGVYSFGNNTELGSSLTDYLRRQSALRNITVFVIPTTPAQEAAELAYLSQFNDKNGVNAFPDNCTNRTEQALKAGGVSLKDPFIQSSPMSFPASLERALVHGGFGSQSIPQNGKVPPDLSAFNPQ